jgi:hypothetical protein
VRTSVYEKVQADGAIFGDFYHTTRPITLQPTILEASVSARNLKESKLRKVVNDCMRQGGTLAWTPDGSISQFVTVRKHQPLRIKGGWAKQALVALIANDPLIYGSTLNTTTNTGNPPASISATNEGDAPSAPVLIRITGPVTNPAVRRVSGSYDHRLRLQGLTLSSGQSVDISMVNATAVRNDATNVYQYVDFPSAAYWWTLMPGSNTITLEGTGTSAATALRIDWRHAWL